MAISRISAALRVFGIPELLESILLELPVKEILFFQRVHPVVKDIITDSRVLQRALFLQQHPVNKHPDAVPILNPLLTLCHGHKGYGYAFIVNTRDYMIAPVRAPHHATNPLPMVERRDEGKWHVDVGINTNKRLRRGTARAPLRRSFVEASWSGMFLSQPVCDFHVHEHDSDVEPSDIDYEIAGGG